MKCHLELAEKIRFAPLFFFEMQWFRRAFNFSLFCVNFLYFKVPLALGCCCCFFDSASELSGTQCPLDAF